MTEKPQITMTPCKSSAISSTGYAAESRIFAVAFKGGKTYRYADVPPSIPAGLAEAKSVGKYIASNVVGKFKLAKD